MTKSEMELFDSSMLGGIALFLNQYFNCVLPEYALLWMALVSFMCLQLWQKKERERERNSLTKASLI